MNTQPMLKLSIHKHFYVFVDETTLSRGVYERFILKPIFPNPNYSSLCYDGAITPDRTHVALRKGHSLGQHSKQSVI